MRTPLQAAFPKCDNRLKRSLPYLHVKRGWATRKQLLKAASILPSRKLNVENKAGSFSSREVESGLLSNTRPQLGL